MSSHPVKKRKDTRAAWSDPSSYKNYEDTWNKAEALTQGQSLNYNNESGPRLRVVGHLVEDHVAEEPPKPEPQNAFMNVASALVLSGISDKVNEQLATAWLTAASTNSADAVSPEAIQQWLAQRALTAASEQDEQTTSFSSSIPVGNLKKQAAKSEASAESQAPKAAQENSQEILLAEHEKNETWKLEELRRKEALDPEKRARIEAEVKENAKPVSQNARALAAATSSAAAALAGRAREDPPDPSSASSKSLSQAFLLSNKPSKYEPDEGERLPSEGLVNLGNIPSGTTEDGIWAECLKYGDVASVYYEIENQWALVKYPSYQNALTAVEQMSRARSLFGSSQKVEVSLVATRDLQRAEKHCEAFDPATYDPSQDQAAIALQGQAAASAQEIEQDRPRRRRRKRKPEVLDLFDEAQAKKKQRAVAREQRSESSYSDDSRQGGHHRDRRGRYDDDSRDGGYRRDRKGRHDDDSRDGDRDRDRHVRHRRGSSKRRQQEAAPRRRERKTGWEEGPSVPSAPSNATLPMTAVIPQGGPKIVAPPHPDFFAAHGMEIPNQAVQVPQVSFPPKGLTAHGLSCAPVAGFRSAEVRFNNPAHAMTAVSAAGLVLHGRVLQLHLDQTSKDGSKVVVRGLAPGTHWIELKTLFSQIGPVAFVQIKEDPSQPG